MMGPGKPFLLALFHTPLPVFAERERTKVLLPLPMVQDFPVPASGVGNQS
jgi:hypothetical protein